MAPRSTGSFAVAAAAFVATGWLGMLVGVSFLATPVKFQALSLDLSVALAGQPMPPSMHHMLYAAMEAVKAAVLAAVALVALFRLGWLRRSEEPRSGS